jgi:hypothetical protein
MLGMLALRIIPAFVRDAAYQAFARNRGTIWKRVKQLTGMGDTMMHKYKPTILGLDEVPQPLPVGWGFGGSDTSANDKKNE